VLHIQEHVVIWPIAMHDVAAFGLSAHGFIPFTQIFRFASQEKSPMHASTFNRSHTVSIGPVHGSVCTQFICGSQYELLGHAASFGVCLHLFAFASQLSLVHATPSSQFIGLPVGTQKPPMHATPLLPEQMFGAVQSSVCTHVFSGPPSLASLVLASGVDPSPNVDASSPVLASSPPNCCVVELPFAHPYAAMTRTSALPKSKTRRIESTSLLGAPPRWRSKPERVHYTVRAANVWPHRSAMTHRYEDETCCVSDQA
jgi:hypothetical protein